MEAHADNAIGGIRDIGVALPVFNIGRDTDEIIPISLVTAARLDVAPLHEAERRGICATVMMILGDMRQLTDETRLVKRHEVFHTWTRIHIIAMANNTRAHS